MTNRDYIATITDEFEKFRYIVELARQYPEYDSCSYIQKRRIVKEILDEEVKNDS